nr:MAG TPA: hypothetical protein [Bacteriophage sp.]
MNFHYRSNSLLLLHSFTIPSIVSSLIFPFSC